MCLCREKVCRLPSAISAAHDCLLFLKLLRGFRANSIRNRFHNNVWMTSHLHWVWEQMNKDRAATADVRIAQMAYRCRDLRSMQFLQTNRLTGKDKLTVSPAS